MEHIKLKARALERIAWGKPDSPQRPLCSYCHGKLPEVPLMLWRPDGGCAQFCDACAAEVLESSR